MQLYFYMCANLQGVADVSRLVNIMLKNNLVLTRESHPTSDGKLGPIPYQGDILAFVQSAYHSGTTPNPDKLISSRNPGFRFKAITPIKYHTPDIPRYDYITVTCSGITLGPNNNYFTGLMDFRTTPELSDTSSPYFEEGAQFLVQLGIDLYESLRPRYGWLEYAPHDFPSLATVRVEKELNTLYWGNYFGPQYVEKYGSKFLLDSPCWRKELLPDGGVFLQLSELYTQPVSGAQQRMLQEYFSSRGITIYADNPFDENHG